MIIKPRYNGPQMPTTYAVTMTAAGSGSNGITVADDDDIDFGTGDFFLHWEGSLPDWTPSAAIQLIRQTSGAGVAGVSLNVTNSTSGQILLIMRSAATSLSINSTSVNLVPNGSIAKITAVVVRESASVAGSATFYINGNQLGSPVAISSGSPFSVTTTQPTYISGTDFSRIESTTVSCVVGNFAPAAAEVLELCTNGIPSSWKWGSQSSAVSGSALNGTSTRAFASFSGSSSGFVASNAYNASGKHGGWDITVQTGWKYRIKFDYTISTDSGTITGTVAIRASRSDTATLKSTSHAFASSVVSSSGSAIAEIVATDSGSFFLSFLEFPTGGAAGNLALTISNAEITRLGATFAALPETIPTSGALEWPDSSGNTGGGTLPAAGATKVTIRK